MDKTAIRNFAIWARKKLIEDTEKEAALYGITEKGIETPLKSGKDQYFNVPGRARAVVISGETIHQRERLARRITKAAEGRDYKDGYHAVMEEIAYTWFNRLIAIRFMEVNDYLPGHIRPLSSVTEGKVEPDLMTWPENSRLPFTDDEMRRIRQMKNENDSDALFGMLFLKVCNQLHTLLPRLFEKTDDDTELLLRLPVMDREGVVYRLAHDIPEEDWKEQVQIVGWMYQYYNTEPKKDVFDGLKKNKKITKDTIAPATQLFTPDWIVRYMVENSLGRLWLEGHPDAALQAKWKYYIPEAKQDEAVEEKLRALREERKKLNPEDLTFLDPCMGSGHILAYAFDLLMDIYRASGRDDRSAVESIITHNLYGLEIDERAAQLAYFEVMMKGREYDRRFLNRGIAPHTYAVIESNDIDPNCVDYFTENNQRLKSEINTLILDLHDGKEFGSILEVSHVDFKALYVRFNEIKNETIPNIYTYQVLDQLLTFVKIAEIMSKKYHVVVTNPPYIGLRNMSVKLFDFVMKKFKDVKQDLFGVFMKVCIQNYCIPNGYVSMITQHVWMFISGFEVFRKNVYRNLMINSLIHLGTHAFEEISGEVVQTCAFVINNTFLKSYKSNCIRLVSYDSAEEKERQFFNPKNQFVSKANSYQNIIGEPFCYWLDERVINVFRNNPLIGDVSNTRQGLKTSDDKRFVRFFYEVENQKIGRNIHSLNEAVESKKKWFWLNKGGQIKWYGNNLYLINWEHDGKEVKDYATQIAGSYSKNITAIDAYFKSCISWPQISISHPSFRYIPNGYIFASAGPSLFVNNITQKWYMLGLLNSCITQEILDAINPTINFGVSDILKVPFVFDESKVPEINRIVKDCIQIAKDNWDSHELSWDFVRSPLCALNNSSIADVYDNWEKICKYRRSKLSKYEEELNRIFCEIYGLQDLLKVEVCESDVNVDSEDLSRDIKHFISYAIGCMFGRYSLDVGGIAYAGGDWDKLKYKTFIPDADAILPITDDEYFKDDIVGFFVEFLKTVYGASKLEENLKFIADALGIKGGSSREVLRNYFLKNSNFAHGKHPVCLDKSA